LFGQRDCPGAPGMPETLRNVAWEGHYTERAKLGVKKGNSGRVGCKTGLPLAVTAERTSGLVAADKSRCYDTREEQGPTALRLPVYSCSPIAASSASPAVTFRNLGHLVSKVELIRIHSSTTTIQWQYRRSTTCTSNRRVRTVLYASRLRG
jgi:hypothetical protein